MVKYSGSGRFCKRSPYICRVRSVSGWPRATAATEHEKKPELCWTECKCIWRNEKFPVASFFIYRGTSVSALVHQEKLMLIFRQKTWGFVFPSEIFLCSSWILPLQFMGFQKRGWEVSVAAGTWAAVWLYSLFFAAGGPALGDHPWWQPEEFSCTALGSCSGHEVLP